ncbi:MULTISPECIES: hypothetical protein [Serratia]|uniref:hypothetical protein n=1 Tax=Serratia TaxID=613 RepID=UPI00386CD69F
MDNKLSELSKPVAWTDERGNLCTNRNKERGLESRYHQDYEKYTTPFYSQEYVSALLAELEAKDKRIAELEANLANREAKPVAYIADCGTIVSESDPFFDEYKNPQPLYTAPPAPAYPERLPCPVHLLPGLKFGKGVPTRSMLDALKRREEYEAELDAMTPEQKAENDARLDKLKELIPQPAMPGIITASMAAEKAFRLGAVLNGDEAEQFAEGWNACRAAMLAQPLPADLEKYTQGIKDGLEWAARTVEANHPDTCDWLYDDRDDLAKAIRKGPDMLAVAPGGS